MEGLICNQRDIPREQWRYGLRSSAATGCGWIAVYNALQLMGCREEPEKLIKSLQLQLPLIHGNAGTSFWGPAALLRKWGYPVKLSARRQDFDAMAAQADACILYYFWRRGAKLGAHFVALHATPEGFVGYNTYRNSKGPDAYGPSLEGFLKQKGYFGAVLTAVGKK